MPSINENKKISGAPLVRGPIAVKVMEKPKNFKIALIKLIKSLKCYRVNIIIAVILAMTGSIISLVTPNKLSDLTNKIADGLVINQDKMAVISNDILKTTNKDNISTVIGKILSINLDKNIMYEISSSNSISNNSKQEFLKLIPKIQSDPKNSINYLASLPEDILKAILHDSIYSGIKVSISDKIDLLKLMNENANNTEFNSNIILNMPYSVKQILLPKSVIDNVEVSTEDKVSFIETMSKLEKKSYSLDTLKEIDKLPQSILKLVKPKMDINAIFNIVVLLVILYVISALFTYIVSIFMATLANKFAKKLRTSISTKINNLPLKYFDNNTTGDILSRVTNDVDTVAQSMNQSLATFVSAITLFIGSIIMMFYTNWIMALTAIVSSLFGFVFMFLILNKSQKYFSSRQTELGKLNGHIEEIYSGLNVVKAYNGEKEARSKFDDYNNKVYVCSKKSQFLSGLMQPIMIFIGNFGYVAVCVIGALLVSKDIISFGVIVAFTMYIRLFTNPLSQIAQAMTSVQSATAASERIFEFLDEQEMSSQEAISKKIDKNEVKGEVEFNHVKFGYDKDKIIIKDFSAIAKKGQKVAIVGPTGAGKTTMVNLLMKFYEIDSGEIKIEGIPISELSRENVHSLFTMVLQDTWLFDGTLKENIVYNKKNVTDERIKKVCETVGIDHFIKTLPNGYDSILSDNDSVSAGERQLLTIARGMIEDEPFLILDEATSNVDTRTEELVQKAMDKLMENRTSFIIAHRLSTIKNADLILVMKDGNIIEQGNHEALIEKGGFYAELYNSQFTKANS